MGGGGGGWRGSGGGEVRGGGGGRVMTSALRRLAGPSLDWGDVRPAGADFICAAGPPADDPICRPPGSHQPFARRKSMKDSPGSFKALPSVQRYRALSNANLQHDSGPQKGCETPPFCGQSRILQLFFKLSLAQHTLRKKPPKTQNAYSAKHSRAVESTIVKQKIS